MPFLEDFDQAWFAPMVLQNATTEASCPLHSKLARLEDPRYIVQLLHKSDLARLFPADALNLLDIVLDNQPWAPRELGQCLAVIAESKQDLAKDFRYHRLVDYSKSRGI